MNDQHPHAGYVGYNGPPTGHFDNDPLFGALPDEYDGGHEGSENYHVGSETGHTTGYGGGYGQYDTTQWDTGAQQTVPYDAYAAQVHQQYDTAATWLPGRHGTTDTTDTNGQWGTTGWNQGSQGDQGPPPDHTGPMDHVGHTGQWPTADTDSFEAVTFNPAAFDSGAYDATAWNTGATAGHPRYEHSPLDQEQTAYQSYEPTGPTDPTGHSGSTGHSGRTSHSDQAAAPYEPYATATFSVLDLPGTGPHSEYTEYTEHTAHTEHTEHFSEETPALDAEPVPVPEPDSVLVTAGHPVGPSAAVPSVPRSRSAGRSRRRSPAKRSALLTVAVPSACVMSVAGIAAASVGGLGGFGGGEEKKDDTTTTMAAADPASVKPVAANNKLDAQLESLRADAENFADRASRTQERIDLKERQAAEKKKREREAAAREAARPKFVLPVQQHGLSAYFGQAGVNWMSVHTGIDFPVSYGTPVMAATDGTVRTQWNNAYGNMAIVTMADGTETWYCHLSSTKIRSGSVKAGDVIAYSGSSGNSTGPHMHFEVRPGGGAAIDPLPWLRGHGVNPN
ncbi:peptidoglycan DD-metalloendopeptidase family protein [Streptomyces sp. DT171]|uniref:M23 family metallopeptidase n=1 Tax=Streptomyces sp. DT171 TaxID=3416524 RepID=UPI003CF22C5B